MKTSTYHHSVLKTHTQNYVKEDLMHNAKSSQVSLKCTWSLWNQLL